METFGKKLKKIRLKNSFTQSQLANKLGLTQVTISKYENDSHEPDLNMIKSISLLFNVSSDYLIGLTAEQRQLEQLTEDSNVIFFNKDNLSASDIEYISMIVEATKEKNRNKEN